MHVWRNQNKRIFINNKGVAGQMHGFNRFPGPPGAQNFPPGFLHRGPPTNPHNIYMPPHQQSPRQQVSYSDITVFHNGANRQQVNHAKNFGHLPRPNFNTPPPRHQITYGDADMFASNSGQQFTFNPQQNPPPRANFPQNQQMGNLWQNNRNQNGHREKHFQNANRNFAENGYNDMKAGHKNRKPWHNNIWNNLPKDSNRKQEQFHKKKKKPKVDKRDLAENNLYFCDTCDRGFKVIEKYQEHVESHIKCRHEGCSYTAHPKLVQLHDRTQHSSGLAAKIWKLESPEDIAKWREERKRNFPTTATVQRKKEILQEKIARGEIIETKSFGKMKNKGGKRDKFGKWKNKRQDKRNNYGKQEEKSPSKIGMAQTKVPVENVEKERSFDGDPLSMLEGLEETIPNPEQTECAIGALASLMANYSDSEEDKPSQTDKHKDNVIPNVENEDHDQPDQGNKRGRKRKRQRKNGSDLNTQPKVRKSTLLEKLLAPNIRRERNLVLQCVYHIVKENFYGIGNSKERNDAKLMTHITQNNTEGQVIKPDVIKTESVNCVSQGCSQTETSKQEMRQETGEERKHLKAQESDAEHVKLDETDTVSEGLIDDHAWE